jgi:hypothetical protein
MAFSREFPFPSCRRHLTKPRARCKEPLQIAGGANRIRRPRETGQTVVIALWRAMEFTTSESGGAKNRQFLPVDRQERRAENEAKREIGETLKSLIRPRRYA